jgi:hypothetical protein
MFIKSSSSLVGLFFGFEGKSYLTFFGTAAVTEEEAQWKRPKLLWFNFTLTIGLMAMLVMGIMPLPILFMLGFAIAITVNYPNIMHQKELNWAAHRFLASRFTCLVRSLHRRTCLLEWQKWILVNISASLFSGRLVRPSS